MAMNFFNFALLLLTFSSFCACYQTVTSDSEIPTHLQGHVSVTASSIIVNSDSPVLDLVLNGQKMDFEVKIDDNSCKEYNFDFHNGRCAIKLSYSNRIRINNVPTDISLTLGSFSFAIANGQVSFGSSTAPCYVATAGVFKLKATVSCPTTITGVSLIIPSVSTPSTAAPAISTSTTASSTSSITATSDISHGSATSTTSAQTSSAYSFPTLSNTKATSSSNAHAEATAATVAEGGLSIGVIAAIIAGVCLCIVIPIVFGLVYYFIIRKKSRKSGKPKTKSKTRSIVKTAPGNRGNKSIGDTGLVSTVASKAGNQSKAKNAPSRFMVNLTGYGNTLLPDNPNEAIELIILKVLSSCRLRSDAQKYDVFDGKLFSNADEFADAILEECRPLFIEYLNTRYELQNHEVDEGTILTIVESLVTPEAVKKGIADARQSAFGYEMLGPIVEGLPSKVATAKPKEGPYLNMSEIRNEGRVFKAITGRKRRPSG